MANNTVSVEELQAQLKKLQLERDEAVAKAERLEKKLELKSSSPQRQSQRVMVKKLLSTPESFIGTQVIVCGWAKTIREQGGGRFAFIELNDGSCFKNVQIVCDNDKPGYKDITGLNSGTGACILAFGNVVKSSGKQALELQALEVELLGKCVPADFPLAGKGIPLEKLRAVAHLRARTNTFGAMARVRNACAMATHTFFQQLGFLYLHTPLITASDCEGAGEMFQITTLLKNGGAKLSDVPVVKETGKPDYSQDFFAKPAFLTVSGQLNGEMYATAVGKIYTFGPTFRAENSHTTRHIAEFWMIEPEMAFADLFDNMDLAEAYLKYVVQFVMENDMEDLEFFDKQYEKGLIERLKKVLATPFKRLTYTEAVDLLLKAEASGVKFQVKVEWGIDLQSEHERYVTEKIFNQPVILTDYPKDIKAFYMRLNEDGKTVRAMDVLVPKIGEIIGGSQREERLEILEKRMEEMKLDKEAYKYYLDLRRFGSCVHSGFGVGFERLIMFISGIENIRDAIPFPRYPGHADF
jgi:asparaginyl-tRNA synthetase